MPEAPGATTVGVIGATSLVGECLLHSLVSGGMNVLACSRQAVTKENPRVRWLQLLPERHQDQYSLPPKPVREWICAAPIWVLPEHFDVLQCAGIRRIVAISSTSVFTKRASAEIAEREIVNRLIEAEQRVQCWADQHAVEWIVLRPTLIYGKGRDKNVTEIMRFIQRFGFFPLLGKAEGLRQPIHAEDVAAACVAALDTCFYNRAFNLSGGETLQYREMVQRIFLALGRNPRLFSIPPSLFRLALTFVRLLLNKSDWSMAMAERMEADLVFDHADAAECLGFRPRPFSLTNADLVK